MKIMNKNSKTSYKSSVFLWASILTVIFLSAPLWPTLHPFDSHESYLSVHIGMEFFAILVAFLVFTTVWNTYKPDRPFNFLILSIAFLAAGFIDFFHALSYPGMPVFITENDLHKSLIFWLSARLIVALGLLSIALLPWKGLEKGYNKDHFLIIALIAVFVVFITGVFNPTIIPPLFIEDQGLTALKVWVEYFIFSIHVVTALILLKVKPQSGIDFTFLALAVWTMGLAELFFTLYSSAHDIFNIMGHIYKVIAYYIIFRAIFIASVESPYEELKEKSIEQLYLTQYAVDHSGDLVYWLDTDGKIAAANGSAYRRLGYDEKELVGSHVGKVETTLLPKAWTLFFGKLQQDLNLVIEGSHFTKEGIEFPCEIRVSLFKFNGETNICAFVRDITERKHQTDLIESSEKRLIIAQRIASIGSWEYNLRDDKLIWSDEIFHIFELNNNGFEPAYDAFLNVIHPDDRKLVNDTYQQSLLNKTNFEIEHRLLMKDGRIKFVIERGQHSYDNEGEPIISMGTVQDITDRKKLEEQAFQDSLTGVYNRRYLDLNLERELNRSLRKKQPLTIAICDIDNFKAVNDTYGHEAGDLLIKEISKSVSRSIRAYDFISRFGGDEFVIVFPNTSIAEIHTHLERIRIEISKLSFKTTDGQHISCTVSIGVAESPVHGKTIDGLFDAADKALYKAKSTGRNKVSIPESEM